MRHPPRWAIDAMSAEANGVNSPYRQRMRKRDAAGARGLTVGSTTICSITSSMISRRALTESGSTLARCAQGHPTTQPAVPRGWMCPVVFRTIQTLTQHLLAAPLYRTGRLILVPFQRALCNHRRKPAGLRSANPRPSLPHRYCLPCCRIANLASSALRSTAKMKLETFEPPLTSLTSTSVARRPMRCTLFMPFLLLVASSSYSPEM